MDAYCRSCGRRANCGFYRFKQSGAVVLICPGCAKDTKRFEPSVLERPGQK